MVDIIPVEAVDLSLAQIVPVDQTEARAIRGAYAALNPEDFELLLWALFKHRQPTSGFYDRATLMISGADRGRDVWLTKTELAAGLVQCKRSAGITAPEALREVIKFLLFAELDQRLKPVGDFVYHLAVSEEPARTTVDFFDAPQSWLNDHANELEDYIRKVINSYSTFNDMDAAILAQPFRNALSKMKYEIIRPADLDAMLHEAPRIRGQFFRIERVIDIESARDLFGELLANTKKAPIQPVLLSHADKLAALVQASHLLADWPQDISGKHIDRPELTRVLQRIETNKAGATLLIGGAGIGKSALLAELYGKLSAASKNVFAIKADMIEPGILNAEDLARTLEIEGSIEDHLRDLATGGTIVVLIDQVDAVSEVMDQSSQRMQILLRLVTRLQKARTADGDPLPIHWVLSSRPFEARFDVRFKQLDAEDIELSLPPYEEVERLLISIQIDASAVPASLKDTLRTPFALALFVELVQLGAAPESLTSGNLLDRWLDRKLPTGSDRLPLLDFLRRLASDMTDHEALWRPAALYEPELSQQARAAEANGLIKREGERLGFAHQSWLDDFQAKRFATGKALVDFAWARQDGLFARGTILRGLEHLRKVDLGAYDEAVRLLLTDSQTRRHVRHLVADLVASATTPTPQEVSWVVWMIQSDQPLANRAVSKLSQTWRQWRDGLKPLLPALMQADAQRWNAITLLTLEAAEDPDWVMNFVERFWSHPEADEAVYRLVEQARLSTERALARLRLGIERTPISEWLLAHLAVAFSEAGAIEAAISLASWWANRQKVGRHQSLDLHDIEKVAARAPLLFSQTFMGWFVTIAKQDLNGGLEKTYPRSNSLYIDWKDRAHSGSLTHVLRTSLSEVARTDPEALKGLLDDHLSAEVDEVQALIADTWSENPKALKDHALAFLLADARRLRLGTDFLEDDEGTSHFVSGWSSGNLIASIGPFLTDVDLAALLSFIRGWQPYEIGSEAGTPSERLQWRRFAETRRLELISKLPVERLDARMRRQATEWANRQPRTKLKRGIGMARFVGPSMSHEQMVKSSDDDLIRLFDEIDDHYVRHSDPTHFLKGGVTELSRAFGAFAKMNPARAINIIRDRLRPGVHERVAGEAVREIASIDQVDPNEVLALIRQLQSKGFTSEAWRHDAAFAMHALAERLHGLEDLDIDRLRDWLDHDAESIEARATLNRRIRSENRVRNEKPDQPPSAILFGNGAGSNVLPQWNFTILSAMAAGLLRRKKPAYNRWLAELESHLCGPEDPEVWSGIIAYRLHSLLWADPSRTTALLEALFKRFPAAFEERFVPPALWYLRERLDEAFKEKLLRLWHDHNDPKLRQVSGEMAAAFVIVGAASPSITQMVDDMLSSSDPSPKVGVIFSAAAGWSEDDLQVRARSHSFLMREAQNAKDFEAHALATSVNRRDRFIPDQATRELLQKFVDIETLLIEASGHFFVRALEQLLLHPGFEELVLAITERMADLALDKSGRAARLMYDGELVSLAVTLQRTPGVRERAMTLYERLLDHAVYGAEEAAVTALRR